MDVDTKSAGVIFLKARWENVIMANYKVPQELLLPYLPNGVELDLYEGEAYISLVGFLFKQIKLFNVPIFYFGTFEEINLRFYVKRKQGNEIKRGVVFINETVPYPIVAYLANKLYHESYSTVPTRRKWNMTPVRKEIEYQWLVKSKWNSLSVKAASKSLPMAAGSLEEFIYEHYYGYAKVNDQQTEEYRIYHPTWKINKIEEYKISCDFKSMYGKAFEILNQLEPDAVFIAEGSEVAIKWKREKITTMF